ncbi:baculoviral IAP repeat-containing protein 2-like [Mizuhopecten yessoensis]|uniref:baculoviral IAP repeat-containing protein 2-like n=1 Tax=Mizuhopecten yessoensis TaxID=6573 RepID=UPI000B45A6AB|nr:baculoviral IAP repeat-containing protein 2-like [Mizuhopecten yessoensis]
MITSSAKSSIMYPNGILENEPRKPEMADQSRMASFFSYPYTSEVSAFELAEAGFHYDGQNDEVMCRQCGLRYSGWQKGDDPKKLHMKIFPCCPFFQKGKSENVFMDYFQQRNVLFSGACSKPVNVVAERKREDRTKQQHESEPFSGTEESAIIAAPNETQTVEQIDQNNREVLSNTGHDSAGHSDTITIQTSTGSLETVSPKYQQFSVLATRLTSYRHWPQHLKQRPEDLAKAGLFYEETNDYVRCFHCAGGLREWEPEDDPFYEHARWFPFCPFMRLIKGDKFIMGVQSGTIKPTVIQPVDKLKSEQSKELNLFDHPAVLSIMEMGYSKTILTKAITIYRKRHGMELSADKLLPVVWEIEETNIDIIQGEDNVINEQTNDNGSGDIGDIMGLDTSVESALKVIDELIEANRELREQKRCKVCLDEEASIVFLPCGHLVTCPMCASALRKCPVCRTYIRGTVKAIIS